MKKIQKNFLRNFDNGKVILVFETLPRYPDSPYDSVELQEIFKYIYNFFKIKNWIKDKSKIVIKPNFVRDYNVNRKAGIEPLVTHPSIIYACIDSLPLFYNKGNIIIGDAPLQNCNFSNLIKILKLKEITDIFRKKGKGIKIEDWRLTIFNRGNKILRSNPQQRRKLSRKEFNRLFELVDLKNESFLSDIEDFSDRFRVTVYNPELMKKHHKNGKHEYLISKQILTSDVIINLPKMKTHIKAGITGALKNLIGINGHKEYLPHHIKGDYLTGGDNYIFPCFFKQLFEEFDEYVWKNIEKHSWIFNKLNFKILSILWHLWKFLCYDPIIAGSWSGNDTIWRTILDLNHILYFYNLKKKRLESEYQRKVITIVDGIIGGEGEGPLAPSIKKAGIVIAGLNPAYVDAVMATLMGFNISRIPTIYQALFNIRSKFKVYLSKSGYFKIKIINLKTSKIVDLNFNELMDYVLDKYRNLFFKPPKWWQRIKRGDVE